MTSTDDWYTQPFVIAALGGWRSFDLDPSSPRPQITRTARRVITKRENGLQRPWRGRVFLNPPYSDPLLEMFLARMAEHGRGTALLFARVATAAFHRFVWQRADAILFPKGRFDFIGEDGLKHHGAREAPALCAYGREDMDILAVCGIKGQFVALRLPRSVVVSLFTASDDEEKRDMSWREVLAAYAAERESPVIELATLYRDFATHPKSRRNPNYRAKLRQQLQVGEFIRVAPGRWERVTRDSQRRTA
jgi:hypothetical protein